MVSEVYATLSRLLEPGSVTELRIPGTRQATVSGYYDDLQKMAQDAARMSDQAPGVYMTLNPVHPNLKARSYNRLQQYAKHTTSDVDILYRRWLPIDFDPDRPAGISSTDAEHDAAIERARQCRDWLASLGFPEPIFGDSGNGAHLLYRIDLPNDPDGRGLALVEACLKALDFQFSDHIVKVDTTTGNAARIWKVYGTLACKGDNLPERSHRQARILAGPSGEPDVVPVALLEKLASTAPKPAIRDPYTRNGHVQVKGGAFDLDTWIERYHLPVVSRGPWRDGRKWVLNPCPWNPAHTDRPAYIVQHANGAIGAGCHHNGCAGNKWHQLRALYEGNGSAPMARTKGGATTYTSDDSSGPEPGSADIRNLGQTASEIGGETGDKARGVADQWPEPPGEAAFHGLAGDITRAYNPYTEADPVAVLANALAAFGCAVGKGAEGEGPYTQVAATRHTPRIYAGLVGKTGRGRKGESWSPVRAILELADPDWAKGCIHSGIGSGEALVWVLRDRVEVQEFRKGKDGEPDTYETVVKDEGVSDKRLLVFEPELARVFQVMARQGSTANSVIREGWDGDKLESLTKGSSMQATDPHIAIVGHITLEELRAELSEVNAANGFANRFIWIAVRRSKVLANPKPFEGPIVQDLAERVKKQLEWARTVKRMERDDEANELWKQVYPGLMVEREGLVWAILGRAEAQVLRLSMLYALLDGSDVIRVPHLMSALELWGYSERSALYIFGDATGDLVADTIYRALKLRGRLSRTEISSLFGRNVSSARISLALNLLLERGKATMFTEDTGGRPVEVWEVIRQAA